MMNQMDTLQKISKIFSHPRRAEIMKMVCEHEFITAKEIMKYSSVKMVPQYLYGDLKIMKDAGLIARSFSEEKQCFIYSAKGNLIRINLVTKNVEICHD